MMSKEEKDLMQRLARLSALLHHYQIHTLRSHGPFGNPHRGQGRVLSILKMQSEISQKQLGYLLDMRNQSLGELLNKLEKSAYITRTPSEDDRRTTNIRLTQAGAEAADAVTQSAGDSDELFASLSAEERATFVGYLDRVIAELEQHVGTMGPDGDEMRGFGPFGRRGPGGPRGPFPHGDGRFGGLDPEEMRRIAHLRRNMQPMCGPWDVPPMPEEDPEA